ncbi:MAG: sigma-54-dependent Fis family transcriptional regulator [Spirochaetaceae bacterium]|nr:sigma-54-dependent Fis family transcriptional regulator [Spirochaetaceae bacterium]
MNVLVVEDDHVQRKYIELLFKGIKQPEFSLYSTESAEPAIEIIKTNNIDLVITDYMMPGFSGMELLKKVKEINPSIDVIVLTAQTDIQVAVEIMKEGARDYLTKPVTLPMLQKLLMAIEEKNNLIRENKLLKEQLEEKHGFKSIISQSRPMENILNTAWRIAGSDASVLITGESGTGKEMLANAIHFASTRKDKILRVVNIAALSESLIDSELFGHTAGAFTGAASDRSGVFEMAHGGTLFIDEVGDIPLQIQIKLLRTIQFGQIQKVGSEEIKTTDVRIIAATNKDLRKMIEEGTFREDLYYRLNVVNIEIPPLRKRKDDIAPLINHFIEKFSLKNKKQITGVSHDAMDLLMKYNYPGNIRELENIVERSIVFSRSDTIKMSDLPPLIDIDRDEKNSVFLINKNYDELMSGYESDLITQALKESNGNKSEAARKLGISERRIRSRIQILKLDSTNQSN